MGGPGRPDRSWRRWRSMGVTCELPQPPRGLVGPWGCFLNETACRFPCRFHLIEPKFAWGVFSCRARSRPNQTNLSMMGVVCTLITHRPTITGDPGLKKVIFSMPHRLIDWCPYEGPATNSGHRNPPRHIPDFEKNQLFYLRPDLPHCWLFPAHS